MKIYYGFRSKEYEDGGDEQMTEMNRGIFCGRPGHRRGSGTIDGWISVPTCFIFNSCIRTW
jgi:hypothetical protein